ncbi:Trp biosynthesis-associated membrane protein [Nocardioides sp.]|uniref:Trp biosynthesis-associated membrane protein n=1 Tax=Nocardioides sp. TaxID=35761 RepID=UPI0035145DEA
MAESRRSSLGPVLLVGVAGGIAAAVAGNRAWVSPDDSGAERASDIALASLRAAGEATAPPVTALALVVLASWGVVLVARGRWRRAVAGLGLLAALGTLGFAIAVWAVAEDELRRDLPLSDVGVSHTAWSYVGVLGAIATVGASFVAVRAVPDWPEMGSRYDSPTGGGAVAVTASGDSDQRNLDLWRALDAGHDPTAPTGPTGPAGEEHPLD